ncbi:hypothetical protein EFE22_06530 [Lactobacillus delbrueckii subsp. lactis]|uniref:Z1 domain-containing protein n=1 Tax=Lactobacillus delbrueckii TaxID=1584 RepID=UPI001E5DCC60|nr:Z1 domain-containing protein [Lactobacillus delbrueckii]MCD5531739.1 Z1 domain-containing protein [Lactobacillus delbrueckii subsp. lactis]MCS8615479.1 hypothetical protein [Lactobacillus delbrueckii subsp. lactis]
MSDKLKSVVSGFMDNRNYNWEQVRENTKDLKLILELNIQREVSDDEMNSLIDEMENEDLTSKENVISLSSNYDNGLKVDNYKYSAWTLYEKLLESRGWSKQSIDNIRSSAEDILCKLRRDNKDAGKGLVVGEIQSGKTANMAALIAQAADNGFNYFIILSGVIDALRKQTGQRMRQDLASNGESNLHWKVVDNPSLKNKDLLVETLDFREKSHDRFITVCLKNYKRLENLYNWLSANKSQQKKMKVLLIDDEADQASINTKDIDSDERTQINQRILDIVNDRDFGAMNYIAYTATPFANVLNEAGEGTLYPKDFIELLTPSENYIGAMQIFGTSVPENSPGLPIINEIPERDARSLKNISKQHFDLAPGSLQDAINWFLLAVAAMRSYGYQKPISMMIHTSFKVADHAQMAKIVEGYLLDLKENYESRLADLAEFYAKIQEELPLRRFLAVMDNYTRKDEVKDYPAWNDVERELREMFALPNDDFLTSIKSDEKGIFHYGNGIHMCIDNSKSKNSDDHATRLIYPDKVDQTKKAPAFIVIGGNTLSRGLTIEGLVSTYFLRSTNQADTLMQMARWFGYRQGYELFPRVWLDENAQKRYLFLSQMNESMRETMSAYATNGLTPMQYLPTIQECPEYQLVRITSSNKMQGAVAKNFNFTGVSPQTTVFDNNKEVLEENLQTTADFLSGLPKYQLTRKNYLLWKDVSTEKVVEYLEAYKTVERDRQITSVPNVIKWLNQRLENFDYVQSDHSGNWDKWNVVLINNNSAKKHWYVAGAKVGKVSRSRKKLSVDTDGVIDIGVLRSPEDQLSDITDKELTSEERDRAKSPAQMRKIRGDHNLGNTPQLLIYCIDKDSTTTRKDRKDLNAEADIIGLSIMIPGYVDRKQNRVDSIQIDISRFIDTDEIGGEVNEEEFEDEN